MRDQAAKHTSGSAADPNGPGTPGGRMRAVWEWIDEEGKGRVKVLEELCPGWSLVSSRIAPEQALMVAFDALVGVREQLRQAEAALYECQDILAATRNREADLEDHALAALRVERDAAVEALEEIRSLDASSRASVMALEALVALAAASRSSTEPPQTDLGVGQKPSVVTPEEGAAL